MPLKQWSYCQSRSRQIDSQCLYNSEVYQSRSRQIDSQCPYNSEVTVNDKAGRLIVNASVIVESINQEAGRLTANGPATEKYINQEADWLTANAITTVKLLSIKKQADWQPMALQQWSFCQWWSRHIHNQCPYNSRVTVNDEAGRLTAKQEAGRLIVNDPATLMLLSMMKHTDSQLMPLQQWSFCQWWSRHIHNQCPYNSGVLVNEMKQADWWPMSLQQWSYCQWWSGQLHNQCPYNSEVTVNDEAGRFTNNAFTTVELQSMIKQIDSQPITLQQTNCSVIPGCSAHWHISNILLQQWPSESYFWKSQPSLW